MLDNGRPSLLPPCPNKLRVKEKFDVKPLPEISLARDAFIFNDCAIGDTIFERSKDDNKVGLLLMTNVFLEIMDREMCMDESNSWVAPHPFRTPRQRLPNNRDQVLMISRSLYGQNKSFSIVSSVMFQRGNKVIQVWSDMKVSK